MSFTGDSWSTGLLVGADEESMITDGSIVYRSLPSTILTISLVASILFIVE